MTYTEIDARSEMLTPKIYVIGFISENGPQTRKMSRKLSEETGKMGATLCNYERVGKAVSYGKLEDGN